MSSTFSKDLLASVVVFLVALPLCMGIAIASGVPPALGLITGMIGGLVVGFLAGAPLLVSGPAAGLTVLIVDLVRQHGIEALGPVVLLGGLVQFIAGRLKVGQWFRAMSPAVIYGMLAGIGVLIFASQFHVMLDDKPKSSGLLNLISIPEAIYKGIFPIDGSSHELAAVTGLLTIVSLILWDKFKPKALSLIPGALIGVILGSATAALLQFPVQRVNVPANLLDAVSLPSLSNLSGFLQPVLLLEALALAFIASAETLLAAGAVDRMQKFWRTDYDRELSAQGVGNMLCGLVGALPMTGVIVRSSTNVLAGARTRLSAILHGVWLLAFVALLPFVLQMIPTASLGAILVFTGYKLVDVKNIRHLATYGRFPVLIYAVTVITIVSVDLLTGVLAGIGLSIAKLVYKVTHLEIQTTLDRARQRADVKLIGTATFIKIPKLATALESLPPGSEVHFHIEQLAYIDHACLDVVSNWRHEHEKNGGSVRMDGAGLMNRFERIGVSVEKTAESVAGR
jgi:MFS superfamily sulfate permease-like transporter